MRISLLCNLALLLAIGFLIGEERQKASKIIGVRTTTLIMLAAFTFTYISVLIGDASRMAAGVASAVGFIGAGAIWKGSDMIGNLTTAVLVLVLAAIGCMLALGFQFESIIISIITFVVLHFYKKLNHNA